MTQAKSICKTRVTSVAVRFSECFVSRLGRDYFGASGGVAFRILLDGQHRMQSTYKYLQTALSLADELCTNRFGPSSSCITSHIQQL